MRVLASVFVWLLLVISADAQQIGGNVSLPVSPSARSVMLPANIQKYPAVVIAPAPGASGEIFFLPGGSAVAALLTSPTLAPGGQCLIMGNTTNYISAIMATGSATLRITQYTQCPQIYQGSAGGSSSGGGGGAAANIAPAPGTLATNQVPITTTATPILAARPGIAGVGRVAGALVNIGTATVYIGNSALVSAVTGMPILPGGSAQVDTTSAVYGITANSTTTTVAFMETY